MRMQLKSSSSRLSIKVFCTSEMHLGFQRTFLSPSEISLLILARNTVASKYIPVKYNIFYGKSFFTEKYYYRGIWRFTRSAASSFKSDEITYIVLSLETATVSLFINLITIQCSEMRRLFYIENYLPCSLAVRWTFTYNKRQSWWINIARNLSVRNIIAR